MRLILEFNDFKSRVSGSRTKSLAEEEFLSVFRENCKNFSFKNDQLWRKTDTTFGELGLYFESERKGTIGTYNYKDFFDKRKDYIVPRYKSLIGSTTKEGADVFGSGDETFMVIPFDNANIVFAGSPDMALWSRSKQKVYSDKLFLLRQYEKNFKVPLDELYDILMSSSLNSYRSIIDSKNLGFEFFTNSNCLLISQDKIDWLRDNIQN